MTSLTPDAQALLDFVSDGFIVINRDWTIVFVNAGYMKLVEPLYSAPGQLVGKNLWDRFPDIADADIGRRYRAAMEAQKPDMAEIFYEPLQRWLEVRMHPGEEFLSIYVADVTQRKDQEEQLARLSAEVESQAKLFDAALSNITDLAYVFDSDARFLYVNRPLLELFGLPSSEVIGKNLFELDYPPELAKRLDTEIRGVLATGKSMRGETYFTAADGSEDHHEYIFNPVFGENGKVAAVAGSTRFTTERKNAEASMRRLAAIVESSDDAIISKDINGIITSWNKAAERMLGYKPEEVIGRSITMLIPEGRGDEMHRILERVRRSEHVDHYETVRRRKDGTLIEVSLTVSPLKDSAGNVIGASKIARDISEKKAHEATLRQAKEAAEAANASKDRFLAVLSHELRTPLTPVLMAVSLLELDPSTPESVRGDLAMIRRNVELETRLIDDLLDLNRISAGKVRLDPEIVEIDTAVREVCEICRSQISEKSIELRLDLGGKGLSASADSSRLQQVLWNLLNNAVKFTPQGGTIAISTRATPAGNVAIAIKDSGIGISKDELGRIFEAFEQGASEAVQRSGGLGLGLAISKALIDLHGGTLRAESEGRGLGATFTVELPIERGAPSVIPEKKVSETYDQGKALRILLVEDHPDTAAMLARLLESDGHAVRMAGDVATALELLRDEPSDLLISDVGLEGGTGYDLLREAAKIRPIPAMAMSGFGMDEDTRRSLEAGFLEHFVKPLDYEQLRAAIRRLSVCPAL